MTGKRQNGAEKHSVFTQSIEIKIHVKIVTKRKNRGKERFPSKKRKENGKIAARAEAKNKKYY